MKQIKAFIIHSLGGITDEEAFESQNNAYQIGKYTTIHNVRTYMEMLDGKPADEWCKIMWEYANRIENDALNDK